MRLLDGAKGTLSHSKNTATPITTHQVVREMLRIPPDGVPATITERQHDDAINGHAEAMAQAAEAIRQELLPVATLTSDYCDEARQMFAKLEASLAFIVPVLNPSSIRSHTEKKASHPTSNVMEATIKTETHDDNGPGDAAQNLANADPSPVPILPSTLVPASTPSKLPGTFVQELIGGHERPCPDRDPNFARATADTVTKRLRQRSAGDSAEATKQHIINDTREKHGARPEKDVMEERRYCRQGTARNKHRDSLAKHETSLQESARAASEAKRDPDSRARVKEEVERDSRGKWSG